MNATNTAIRDRMTTELATLQEMVAGAPADHPARVACDKIAAYLLTASSDWLEIHTDWPVRTLANEVAKGTVPGICKPW